MELSDLCSIWTEFGYDRPELEESHEPDQTILKVYLKTSTESVKTSTKETREKKRADVVEPLENKGETVKTVGKKTVGKSAETREKKFVLSDEELEGRSTIARCVTVQKESRWTIACKVEYCDSMSAAGAGYIPSVL